MRGYFNRLKDVVFKDKEENDPTPLISKVAFKKPLSAHQRILRAIRTHEALKALDAADGDASFDLDPSEGLTPYQIMHDENGVEIKNPATGHAMTAAEHVMLQEERELSKREVRTQLKREADLHIQKAKKKAAKPPKKESQNDESDED